MEQDSKSAKVSEEERVKNEVGSMLATVFGDQTQQKDYQYALKESMDSKRHMASLELENNIASGIDRLNMFNKDFTAKFYNKSLDLQYRSLLLQKEHLDHTITWGSNFTHI